MRKCFTCKQEISLQDAITGRKILDMLGEKGDFDIPWINCIGSDDEFIKEDDTELLESLKGYCDCNFIGSILLHPECIKKDLREYRDWLAERGNI
jgi:hypothetical protein